MSSSNWCGTHPRRRRGSSEVGEAVIASGIGEVVLAMARYVPDERLDALLSSACNEVEEYESSLRRVNDYMLLEKRPATATSERINRSLHDLIDAVALGIIDPLQAEQARRRNA